MKLSSERCTGREVNPERGNPSSKCSAVLRAGALTFSAAMFAAYIGASGCAGDGSNGDDTPPGGGPSSDASTDAPNSQFSPQGDAANDAFIRLDSGCATGHSTTSKDPAYLEFLLDASASMQFDNKWTAVVAALTAAFNDMAAKADPSLAAGLIVFSGTSDPTHSGGPYPNTIDIPPGFVSAAKRDAMNTRMSTTKPNFETPTFEALKGAYSVIRTFQPSAGVVSGGHKVVVILTDGIPNNGAVEQAQCNQLAADELVLAAPQGPVKTFVVGVGPFGVNSPYFMSDFLGELAVAGGTRSSPACDPHATVVSKVCHYQIDPTNKTVVQLTADFIQAINNIRGRATGCEYALESTAAGTLDPSKVNVIWKDSQGVEHIIAQDAQNGWVYDNPAQPTKVILTGATCTDVAGDIGGSVDVILGCATVIL